ncbi:SDR family NAD(P)-dependent oxidoreductase [Amnibacterium flavum]|uniref:Oxidoreductase n=1 Tax=Amnibacterium flavum TaxID=2173173 RepID=A0A2V1HXH1_9MICO|nr:SDR family oxidoreductase [Amnibacterium flavum]PVZ95014.1 oxidoreductase [Amnibacterium flavum]
MTNPGAARRFEGSVAVIVGGGRGIGRATGLRLAAEGAHVVVADSAVEYAVEVAQEIREAGGTAESSELDATDSSSVGRFFYGVGEQHPRLDVLINCPAHASDTHFERVTDHEFDVDVAVTLKAPFLCIQAALPLLLRSPNASVVSITSVNGLAGFGNEAYGAAKAGLMNLTKNLALRYGPHGVRFNTVAPGTVRTRSWEARVAEAPGMLERISDLYPLRRVGEPDDIAAACAFLASPEAGWITGTTLTVDGGITAGDARFLEATFGPAFFETTLGDRPSA